MVQLRQTYTIFMVTNNYTPYSGGVVSALKSYVHELEALGHRVFIITLDFLGSTMNDEKHVIRLASFIRFTHHKNYIAVPFKPTQSIASLVEKYKPDIIHTHHPFLLGKSGLKVAKKKNIPVVFTYHTLYEKYLHYIPFPMVFTQPITRYLVQSYCKKVNAIILPSTSLKDHIDRALHKNITVIPSGILGHFMKQDFEYKRENTKFTLLSVSRFTPEKNIPFLIQAFAQLSNDNYQLLLVGYGAYLKELQSLAYNEFKLTEKNIKFIIKPSKAHLLEYYDNADLFIFSSQTETQGLVLAEAMARGTPVLALEGSAIGDIIENGCNGYIIQNQQEMIDKIHLISHNRDHHKILQHGAWKTSHRYNPINCAKKLESLYRALRSYE